MTLALDFTKTFAVPLGNGDPLNMLEEWRESDGSDSLNLSLSSSSSPQPSPLRPSSSSSSSRPSLSHLHELADPYLPSFRGKDLSDARAALAKVLTSSVSKGALVQRLKNSSTFPKFSGGGSSSHVTHRCWDEGARWSERLPASSLSAEPEWEDPSERRGTSTFKVVPSGKQSPDDVEIGPDVAGQTPEEGNANREASPKPDGNPSEVREDLGSPDTDISLLSHRPFSQETEDCDRPVSHSLPLGSDSQVCLGSPPPQSEVGDEKQSEGEEQAVATAQSDLGDEEPSASDRIMEASSGSPQSPIESPQNPSGSPQSPSGSPQSPIGSPQTPIGSPQNHIRSPQSPFGFLQNSTGSLQNSTESLQKPGGYSQNPGGSPQSPTGSPQSPCGSPQNSIESHQNPGRSPRRSESSETDLEEVENAQLGEEEDEEDNAFPPPPSPIFFSGDAEELEASPPPSSRPLSPASAHCEDPHPTNSGAPAQPGAAAEPRETVSAAAPSRFAEAVALAVQRSRLQRQGKGPGPQAPSAAHSALPSPHISIYQFGK